MSKITPNQASNREEDEQYYLYLQNPDLVDDQWKQYFQKKSSELAPNGQVPFQQSPNAIRPDDEDIYIDPNAEVMPLMPIPTKIAENMELSTQVPTATSTRTMPVKALDENRRIINKYLEKVKRPKISFTYILAWAIVKALIKYPHMNDAFIRRNGRASRVKRKSINIGLAIDITKKDGTRLLLVPNVKDAQTLNFNEYIQAFADLIEKSRNNTLGLSDLEGTTITLTNPGMIGTSASSPRLMKGQGLIVATGSIDYPPEFQAVRPEMLTTLAVSKVVTMTNTYDHRIIQGAESAEFLDYLNKLLIGKYQFYDHIFASLKIPFEPIRWASDTTTVGPFGKIDENEAIEKAAHVMLMINAYRVRGHLLASVNPLGFVSYYYPELDPAYYGFTIWDLDRVFHADDNWDKNNINLREIIERVRDTYCGPVGIEYMHIQDPNKKNWIKKSLETTNQWTSYAKDEKLKIFNKLIEAENFENFLHTKFVGHKRFSLEGSESLIVLMDKLLEHAADSELDSMVIGMAHRGRLNVLVNNVGKSIDDVFDEFEGIINPNALHGTGDVKYHMGDEGKYKSSSNKEIKVILSPNPSHLELVDPVIEGMARALDNEAGDSTYRTSLPILMHGDAAFAGQGIVSETLNLSQLEAYKTGGTIHIIVNNQIGFTTTAEDARSTIYCTDVAKMIQVPIIHVNGNDPEAVRSAASFAYEYRNKFNCDVIIDMISYRKYGHNEADEPSYTQPLLYKRIKKIQPVRKIYQEELVKDKIITQEEGDRMVKDYVNMLNDHFAQRRRSKTKTDHSKNYKPGHIFEDFKTQVERDTIMKVAETISDYPANFNVHPKLGAIVQKRIERVNNGKIDWALAEALSFGTILLNDKEIRFSGQDVRRGTFSQRHAVLTDILTEDNYTGLNHIDEDNQGIIRIFDSPLSEIAVLGFEYGYSLIASNSLTLWEAQFGDFANGAQPIFDQFIACGESKWGKTSNLVVLLPHSYDGQGPEHSSARPERYLQLCANENMIVCNLTTPAQYFHVLRRQVLMPFKKPLVIMTPKSMLRNVQAVSTLEDLSEGRFYHLIEDNSVEAKKVKRVVLSTGKIYYDLLDQREKSKKENVALVRVEQIYPFNTEKLMAIFDGYPNAEEFIWIQEEPKNMGAWPYLSQLFYEVMPMDKRFRYVGRAASPATATGLMQIHLKEQKQIVLEAIEG
jgi:multifunctional 2-oxoglutarate metabolism enzyme